MKSPFPGMDPYLEAQGRWRDLHVSMITYCRDALKEVLPENFVAQIEVEPITDPLMRSDIEKIQHTWIEIRNLPELDLVTVIEILSPTTKAIIGCIDYLDKRDQYMRSTVNLVELDLLVGGRRLPMNGPMPTGDYYALVARAQQRPDCDVYTWSIREPLPTIPIPLKLLDSDVMLNVDDPFALAYQRGRYARTIDYSRPLDLSLEPKDKAWAEQIAISAMGRTPA
jgi:Protein of unknown function (DUF4058)